MSILFCVHMQGSAADVCKAAMVALQARASAMFADRPGACRLILQVQAPSAYVVPVLLLHAIMVDWPLHLLLAAPF